MRDDYECGVVGGLSGRIKVLGGNLLQVLLCPPEIPHVCQYVYG
jgi:hypothetical protein